MNKQTPLKRTCTNCGEIKPLSAFLYLSAKRGTTYGAICASCRGIGSKRKTKSKPSDEESGSTRVKLRLGAREKAQYEKKAIIQQQEQEQDKKDKKKQKEETKEHKIEKTEQKDEDRKRVEEQLSPISDDPLKQPPTKQTETEKDKPKQPDPTALNPETDKEILLKEKRELEKKEERLGGVLSYRDSALTGTVTKTIGDVHRAFLEFLGESAAVGSQVIKKRRSRTLFSSLSQKAEQQKETQTNKELQKKANNFKKKK